MPTAQPNAAATPDGSGLPLPYGCWLSGSVSHSDYVRYSVVGEYHGWADAHGQTIYSNGMSSSISFSYKFAGGVWGFGASVTLAKSSGYEINTGERGDHEAHQVEIPIKYRYEKVKYYCNAPKRGGARYAYVVRPLGFSPGGIALFRYGASAKAKDGYTQYAKAVDHGRSYWTIVPQGGYYGVVAGQSITYTLGFSIYGAGVEISTTFNHNHQQRIHAGHARFPHDIFTNHGRFPKVGVFYSY